MASRVSKEKGPAAPQGAVEVNDLDVLQPDREIPIAGRIVIVREYRFFEGLRLRAQAKPFFDELYALFDQSTSAPSFDDVAELLGKHEDQVIAMVAAATDCEPDWIRGLNDQDGDSLMVTWWLVNAGFFIRRVMRRAAQARVAAASRSAGPASTTNSSPADTSATPTTSPG